MSKRISKNYINLKTAVEIDKIFLTCRFHDDYETAEQLKIITKTVNQHYD